MDLLSLVRAGRVAETMIKACSPISDIIDYSMARHAPRLRDRAKHIGHRPPFASPRIVSGVPRQIALANDAYYLSPIIDDGQPPNLMTRHLSQYSCLDAEHRPKPSS